VRSRRSTSRASSLAEVSRRLKNVQKAAAALIDRRPLLRPGDKVVVGVSGGADSLCLLHLLLDHRRRYRRDWEVLPVHVAPAFEGWNSDRVVSACRRIGADCTVLRTTVAARECFSCARARRRALFETCRERGAQKLALGHHLEDINETFLLNLIYTSSGAAILPEQRLFDGALTIVRPLYRLTKDDIRYYLRRFGIRAVRNTCPGERSSKRLMVRRFLARLYRADPRTRTNIFAGIHNLKPGYLPGAEPQPGT
jgi:tRNA 2-thiocytidine biosynthesis protein TtcA